MFWHVKWHALLHCVNLPELLFFTVLYSLDTNQYLVPWSGLHFVQKGQKGPNLNTMKPKIAKFCLNYEVTPVGSINLRHLPVGIRKHLMFLLLVCIVVTSETMQGHQRQNLLWQNMQPYPGKCIRPLKHVWQILSLFVILHIIHSS